VNVCGQSSLPNLSVLNRKSNFQIRASVLPAKLSWLYDFVAVNLRTPYRFDNRDPLSVYAVYATEVDCPEGETPVEWMLLTTEVIADLQTASTILRWYSYRWRVEEYHKILKSGCQVERYRLAADGMKALLGFLSVIAVELKQLTYLHRTQPDANAIELLNPLQLQVLMRQITQTAQGVNSCLGCGSARSFRGVPGTST
jgi:hypothetical protein